MWPYCSQIYFSQEEVDRAPLFVDVLESFNNWVVKKQLGTKYSFAVVTDGPWDMGKFLKDQCKVTMHFFLFKKIMSKKPCLFIIEIHYYQVEFPASFWYWVNIRKTFANFYHTSRIPLSTMIQLIGREFQGRAHSGLDDSRNIAAIVQRVLKDGGRIILNEKLADDNPENRREDGTPFFSAPVSSSEFKSFQNSLRPNFPAKRPMKA